MNKKIFYTFIFLLFLSTNTNSVFAQNINLQDIYGEWTFDNMLMEGEGSDNERNRKFVEEYNKTSKDSFVMKYLPDGKFITEKSNQINVEGSWALVNNQIKITTNYGENFQAVKIDKNKKTLTLYVGGIDEDNPTKTMMIFKQK